ASFAYAGTQSVRTRYRPDPWRIPEWVVVLSGAAVLVTLVLAANIGVDGLEPVFNPLTMPAVPLVPAVAILAGALPAFLTPPLPTTPSPGSSPTPSRTSWRT